MRKRVPLFIVTIVLFTFQIQAQKPEWAGIWGAWGSENYKQSWLKGSLINSNWNIIEPKDGVFDFSSLEEKIDKAAANGQYFLPKIYIENCPEWLFEKGTPKVWIDYGGNQAPYQPNYFPYFVNDTYMYHLRRMWSAFQKYIASLPAEKREKFVGFQVPMGRSGDPQPYSGTLPDSMKQYDLPWSGNNADIWTNYQLDMAQSFIDSLKINGLLSSNFYPLFNFTDLARPIAVARKMNINQKAALVGQGYHMNGEMGSAQSAQMKVINALQPDGSDYVRCRGEFDNHVKNNSPWLVAAPKWHYYWHCNWMLTYGLDLFMQRTQTIETGDTHKLAFDFFNDHAGYKEVKTARYAYIALRDGLDIMDITRFSEYRYGKISDKKTRFQTILAEMAPFGARNDDPDNQLESSVWKYLNMRKALNDACQNNWPDNYGRYLKQIEPNVHDQGYWRVGSIEVPYGRFARGFDVKNGKNNLYFDLADDFFETDATVAKKIKLKIIYYGDNIGSWELKYHAADGSMKTALAVTNSIALGRWVTKGVVLTDALLNNGGEKGADLILQNTGKTNCLFHMIEIDRETEDASVDASLQDLRINGATVPGFSSGQTAYNVVLPQGTKVPVVFALSTDAYANIDITDTSAIPGSAVVLVKAEDGVTTKQISVNFTHAPAKDTAPPAIKYHDAGITSIWTGYNPKNEEKEAIRVIQGYMNWDDIEKTRGVYTWTALDQTLSRAEALNKPLVLQINAKIPEWMKNYVPYMGFSTRSAGYPAYQYYHPEYIKIYKELIEAFAERVANDPRKHFVAGVRIQNNAFNTEAWNWEYNNNEVWNAGLKALGGNPDDPANWPKQHKDVEIHYPLMKKGENSIGIEYIKEITTAYKIAFHTRAIRTFVRLELNSSMRNWLDKNYWNDPLCGALITNFGMWWLGSDNLHELKSLTEDYGVVSYIEDTQGSSYIYNAKFPSFEKEIYWRQMIKLYMKMTYAATYGEDLDQSEKPAWKESFEMVNRYAGLYDKPTESSGAFLVWCYYGSKGKINNIGYFLSQYSGSMANRSNIGSNNIPYGHSAKALTGQNAELGLNTEFAEKIKGRNIQIRVTYYDQANNNWDLFLHDGKSPVKITNRATINGEWNVDVFNVSDVNIPGNGKNDITIKRTGSVEPIFHKIEVLVNDHVEQKKNPYETLNIPGIIEAEFYDYGGEGFSYHDDTIREGDTTFRTQDNVDIVLIDSASQQFAVGFIKDEEWLEYSISSFDIGIYDISLTYSSGATLIGDLTLYLNTDSLSSFTEIINTGNSETYQTVTVKNVMIKEAENQVLRIKALGGGFNIDKLEFELKSPFINVEKVFIYGCSSKTWDKNETLDFDYVIMPLNATNKSVSWTSSDITVAVVSEEGLVTAVGGGTAIITVTSQDGEFTANCSVEVKPVSVSDIAKNNLVKVFPNPSEGIFNLQLNHKANATVIDLAGNVVWSKNQLKNGNTSIDLSDLKTGIYILRVNEQSIIISVILRQ